MAVSAEQYSALLARLTKIERTQNDILSAIKQFITNTEVNEVFTVLQQTVDDLSQQVEGLTERVETIENEPYDENS